MPVGEAVGEFFLRILWEGFLHFISYMTGVFLISVFTFGQVGVGEISKSRPRKRKGSKKRKHREVSGDFATVVGLLFWVSVIIIAIVY